MSSSATPLVATVLPDDRLAALFEEMSELTGQRNATDGRLVDIVAEIDHDGIRGATGARSIPALVAWKTGMSPRNAQTLAAIAHRGQPRPSLPLPSPPARPPTQSPPNVAPYPGPTGERTDWWWYDPYQPAPPAEN
jgi:hypothetical protein